MLGDGELDGDGDGAPTEDESLLAVGEPADAPLAVGSLEPADELWVLGSFFRSDSGLNGSRCENVSSFEPCDGPASTSTAGNVSPLGAGVATIGDGEPSEAGLSMTSGIATVAASRPTATGHSRFSRRSCQRSRRKVVIALSPMQPGPKTRRTRTRTGRPARGSPPPGPATSRRPT